MVVDVSVLFVLQASFLNATTKDWKVGTTVVGQVKTGGGLTFAAVDAAGHMVPLDQPAVVRGTPPPQSSSIINYTMFVALFIVPPPPPPPQALALLDHLVHNKPYTT